MIKISATHLAYSADWECLAIVEKMMTEIKLEIKSEMENEFKECVTSVINDLKEKEEKKNKEKNLIFFGVPESKKETQREREKNDTDICIQVISEGVGVEDYHVEDITYFS